MGRNADCHKEIMLWLIVNESISAFYFSLPEWYESLCVPVKAMSTRPTQGTL